MTAPTHITELPWETPTPMNDVARLTGPERQLRVHALLEQSQQIIDTALDTHLDHHTLTGTAILFSGENDSTTLAHIFKNTATHAIHANTTIGIEQTRQFVRDTCTDWNLTLLEETAPTTYRELVLDQGFPGPGHHFKMYQRLKERGLRQARAKLATNPRKERVLFLAGRRRQESARRANIVLDERTGSIIWASPMAFWTKLDMNTYRLMNPDIPRNEVADLIHMSGECLCGSFAKPGELDMIGEFFPDIKAEIHALEHEVRAAGHKRCIWGAGGGKPTTKVGALCTSCESPDGGDTIIAPT